MNVLALPAEAPDPSGPLPEFLRNHMPISPLQFFQGLCAACFGDRDCPTPREWAKFVVSGAIISSCGGALPKPCSLAHPNDVARELWKATWNALASAAVFTEDTRRMLLHLMLPKPEYAHGEHPELVTLFESLWLVTHLPRTTLHSVSQLREHVVEHAAAAFRNSMRAHAPDLALIGEHAEAPRVATLAYMRTRYQW